MRICGAQATAAAAVMEMLHQIVKLAPEMKSFWEPIQAETMFAATTTKPNEKRPVRENLVASCQGKQVSGSYKRESDTPDKWQW